MMQDYNYSMSDLYNMMPWERDIFVSLLKQKVQEHNERVRSLLAGRGM